MRNRKARMIQKLIRFHIFKRSRKRDADIKLTHYNSIKLLNYKKMIFTMNFVYNMCNLKNIDRAKQ